MIEKNLTCEDVGCNCGTDKTKIKYVEWTNCGSTFRAAWVRHNPTDVGHELRCEKLKEDITGHPTWIPCDELLLHTLIIALTSPTNESVKIHSDNFVTLHGTAPGIECLFCKSCLILTKYFDNLKIIQKVLDYAADSDAMRYKILCWVKDAVNKTLKNEKVEEPGRREWSCIVTGSCKIR